MLQHACEGAPGCHQEQLRSLWLMVFLALRVQFWVAQLQVPWALLCPPFCDVLDLLATQMRP